MILVGNTDHETDQAGKEKANPNMVDLVHLVDAARAEKCGRKERKGEKNSKDPVKRKMEKAVVIVRRN